MIEASLNPVLPTNKAIDLNTVDAGNGRATSSLFPEEDFLHTLDIGLSDYRL